MSETTLVRPAVLPDIDIPASPVMRLRRSVQVRTLEHRGVAVSAGHDAVVLDGAAAEQLWLALEPRLRQGVSAEALLASVPERARRVTDGLWQQLVDHRLLCVAGSVGEETVFAAGPLAEHFERTAQDPGRAMARARVATVQVAGDPALAEALRGVLTETGILVDARTDAQDLPLAGLTQEYAVLTLRLAAERHHVLVARAGGYRLVGPLPAGEAERAALRRWLDLRAGEAVTQLWSRDRVADSLAAAQAVLVLLEILGEASPAGPAPVFHVTSPDVVAERHPLAVLPSLGPADHVVDLDEVLTAGDAAVPVDDVLRAAEPLWSGPLTTWRGPVPGALPQLPIGLAIAGTGAGAAPAGPASTGATEVVGVGLDTADARLSCVEQLVERETGLSVGRSAAAAVARAVTRAVLDGLWLPDRQAPAVTTPLARRLLQALTLREGVPVTLRSGSTRGPLPLTRVEVLDERGRRLATGLAAEPDRAVEEALLAGLGAVQAAPHGVSVSTAPMPRLPSTQENLVRWALASGPVVRRPAGSPLWSALGLHACIVDGPEDQA